MCNMKPPICIVGPPHTGSSILTSILSNHSKIYSEGSSGGMFISNFYVAKIKELNKKVKETNSDRWLDKVPNHIFHLDKIKRILPDVKIIMTMRDGRDVAASYKKRENLNEGIQRWVKAANIYLERNDENIYKTKYEHLINQPINTIKNILNFLEEEYEERIWNYCSNEKYWYSDKIERPENIYGNKNHSQLRNWQINQPLYNAIGIWKNDLTTKELDEVLNKERELLELLNYL